MSTTPRRARKGLAKASKERRTFGDYLLYLLARGVIGVALLFPERARLRGIAWLTGRVLGPLAGYRRRAEEQIRFVWPEMPAAEARRIATQSLEESGRTFIEGFAPDEILARAPHWRFHGPGLAPFEEARAAGRAVMVVSGHYGNYQAARAAFLVRGTPVGALWRPTNNAFFGEIFVASVEKLGAPILPRGPEGLRALVSHLRQGHVLAILFDQFFLSGEMLDFLGKPAPTALSAAELALKYDALVLPVYAQRNPEDVLDIEIVLEAPIPHTDPVTMTQAMNDSLAARIRANPAPWFWVHRRWKHERLRRRGRLPAEAGPETPSGEPER